jgi:hypothetical protein
LWPGLGVRTGHVLTAQGISGHRPVIVSGATSLMMAPFSRPSSYEAGP